MRETTNRLYFYRPDGTEYADHPLNGVPFGYSGAFTADRKGRRVVRGMQIRREVGPSMRWAESSGHGIDTVRGAAKPITAADFGADYVICKAWSTSGVFDKFWLAAAS